MNSSTSSFDAGPSPDAEASGDGAYLAWLALAVLLWGALLACFNWAVDPLQIERPAGDRAVYIENQRYQNPGIAVSQDYETVIIGTSHAENIRPSDVLRVFGEKAVKLAISGSTAYEQRLILAKAIETGKVKRVIWALDRISFTKPAGSVSGEGEDFPFHLYEAGGLGHWPYWLSIDTFERSVSALLGQGHRDLDTLNTWFDRYEFGETRVLADWRRRGAFFDRVNRDPTLEFSTSIPDVTESLAANLVPLVRAHPEIQFDVFFPPFSIVAYLADFRRSGQAFADRQGFKRLVVEFAASQPNMNVYDFQAMAEITHDLGQYKDLDHYGLAVNVTILEAIARGEHRVDRETYDALLGEQARQVNVLRGQVCRPGAARAELCPRVAGR